ncbi:MULTISPECIES: Ppx/GppA phosphatase family protein [unclassified Thermosynechococcus]|uniref:Ppx/GppA phosphatase family protein n=1 Tax=unclassified Thermosynechococcus TaxID=2622553 RepID=UPI002872BE99|nr:MULTISPECIES: Ppx/GppA phosphatase family protein [unclassified Thermosynechococcus]WNC31893.1 Ppx/GppA phosphatase family protein [Thermosynechococcus sp. PKX95]WNC34420.1 Ppx/GppA phosphatase family protein [Thermosynechococcus sp. PKX91]WNC36940.1 Ppx/GppA phosphatase family protein [Thermosynechococcus sp. WL11]WNC39461.1 Ppx/GppA phosphatase family protein [Thermosynechococcus sp. WL17]WNC41982.1 Ppx/GppA phosphatase family protein [Thermosynechococcus sp. WL15]
MTAEQHLHLWRAVNLSDRILAAIDVGTNSIHMVVVQIQPSLPSFKIIAAEKDMVRLGERCQITGQLTEEAMKRAIATLRRCRELATGLKAEEIIGVATSAVREAPNGREFLERVKEETGLTIDLISGEEEARRIYLGVLSGLEFNGKPHIIIDIGGGSTELILGDGHEPRYLSSTKVGAVRLTDLFVKSDPISDQDYAALRAYVRGMLDRAVEDLRQQLGPHEKPQLVGTSGTIESLMMIHTCDRLGACPPSLRGYELTLGDLKALVAKLRRLNFNQRCQLLGMSERRAEIIVAGAVILAEAMEMLGQTSLITCDRALREGIIVDWMLTHGLIEDRLRYQSSVRQRSTYSLAQKFHVNLASSERVADFALTLFDRTQGILHNWTEAERELLWAAAILHNAGHYVSHSAHHKHSYYLVRHGGLLGYTDTEIEIIANLCRYHRKSPPKKKHENFRQLVGRRERQIVEQLSAILRLASALDRRQIGAVDHITCEWRAVQREFCVQVHPADPSDRCELEIWSVNYKKEPFESQFGVSLKVELVPASSTALATAVNY